ncbi:MAG: urease accessory protein UreD [Pseudomonadota bacterium]|nr:urease accessory protein UreD [Pseudomonadota bacterium]
MGWHGSLVLRFRLDGARTIVHDRHEGPLRVLKSLHPEGPGICHSVLVHPPGGIVGGDTLSLDLELAAGTHALLSTPGATRFYRSLGEPAAQRLVVRAGPGARLEWLPLETIAYSGCIAENRSSFELAPGAEMIGWDVTALGLGASGQPFVSGRFTQSIALDTRWLERGTVRGDDTRLLRSPLGWAGRQVLATLWFAAGSAIVEDRRDLLLEAAREAMARDRLADAQPPTPDRARDSDSLPAGASAVQPEVVVVRALADRVEPAMALLTRIWRAWRRAAWQLEACAPRVWQT